MAFFGNLPLAQRRRLAQRDIDIVKAVLKSWGWAPDWNADDLLNLSLGKGIGRAGHDDTDRNLVKDALRTFAAIRDRSKKLDRIS